MGQKIWRRLRYGPHTAIFQNSGGGGKGGGCRIQGPPPPPGGYNKAILCSQGERVPVGVKDSDAKEEDGQELKADAPQTF